MYIEPCCIDNQLPKVMKEARGGFAFFQTNGDVTLEKLLGAVSCLAGPTHEMVLAVGEVDVMMLRTLAYYFRRGWTRGLHLVTATAQTELVRSELGDWIDRVTYAADPLIVDGIVACIGEAAVIIQGAVLSQPDFSLTLYTGYYGRDEATVHQALDPLMAKLRTKPIIISKFDHEIHLCIDN